MPTFTIKIQPVSDTTSSETGVRKVVLVPYVNNVEKERYAVFPSPADDDNTVKQLAISTLRTRLITVAQQTQPLGGATITTTITIP